MLGVLSWKAVRQKRKSWDGLVLVAERGCRRLSPSMSHSMPKKCWPWRLFCFIAAFRETPSPSYQVSVWNFSGCRQESGLLVKYQPSPQLMSSQPWCLKLAGACSSAEGAYLVFICSNRRSLWRSVDSQALIFSLWCWFEPPSSAVYWQVWQQASVVWWHRGGQWGVWEEAREIRSNSRFPSSGGTRTSMDFPARVLDLYPRGVVKCCAGQGKRQQRREGSGEPPVHSSA